jgi:hypothetical protein
MLANTPKLVFSGYVNNNSTDRMISEAIYRASGFIKPEKPQDQFQNALYNCGEALY